MGLYQKISQLREFLEETLKILYYYKSRVAFSFSGVALGILSICVIITTIDGANKKAYEIFEALGPDSIIIFGGSERQRTARERLVTLTVSDADMLEKVGGVYDVLRVFSLRNVNMKYKDRKWQTQVAGGTENYFYSFKWGLQSGSFFSNEAYRDAEAECVIGAKVYEELFKGEKAIGRVILIGRLPTKVVGVLNERGGSAGGPSMDDRVVMPLTTVTKRLANEKRFLSVIRLKTNRDVDATIEDVKMVIRKNHGIPEGGEDNFTTRSSKDILQFVSVISGSLFLFLGTASIIALVVSGFVLANLFYLTIQERKKDIGIRRAYGATRKGILMSFLFESVIITIMGGIAGVLLSVALQGLFERLFGIPMEFSFKVVFFAMIFSLLTGVLSGLKPAMKASKIEPIEAIRG
ncbi:MAG TPA: ABC transporter permease [Syntrophorhabdaceae bacterium]|jgi:putative ABC transport system permease protein|nr:ABC transporter permease [Syntrophorhabdaceae bacterium]HOS05199.1 ABC transporter permease [Syntrophorhabdaceae bacterium]HPL41300.1 ABC transporter permease [Syntrophorhabdaceae bacterium]